MRPTLVAGNWKLHKSPAEARAFVRELKATGALSGRARVGLFPSAFALAALAEEIQAQAVTIAFGPQNIYFEKQGAFTGENSPAVAKELGATYALIGHSERRSLF